MTRKAIEAFGGDANAAPSRSDESAGPATRDAPNTPQVTDKAPLIGLSQGEGNQRRHVMPGDPHDLGNTALQWYLDFQFGYPHSVRESNIAVEAFKDGFRAALSGLSLPGRGAGLREALIEARDVLAVYADPTGYTDNDGEQLSADETVHPGLLAKGAVAQIEAALSALPQSGYKI